MTDHTVARTILNQLGGKQFTALTGAKDFVAGEDRLIFRIGRNPKRVTHVRVTLLPSDTYLMEFIRVRAGIVDTLHEASGVYFDQLQDIFEAHTGLLTTFKARSA